RVHLIPDTGEEAAESRQPTVQLGRAGLQCVLAHQPLDPAPADPFALPTQFGMDPRTAVSLPARPVHLTDTLNQPCILLRPLAGRPITPRVVAAGADAKQPAQASHRVVRLLLLDEGKAFAFRAEVNAIAFFKRSCSIFNCS